VKKDINDKLALIRKRSGNVIRLNVAV